DVLDRNIDPLDVRFLLLSTHYRKTLNFTFEALDQEAAARRRIIDFLYELEHRSLPAESRTEWTDQVDETLNRFRLGLSDDLNISLAITAMFELIRSANSGLAAGRLGQPDAQTLRAGLESLDEVLGVLPAKKEVQLEDRILNKIEEREQARRAKEFIRADQIRVELLAEGVVLEDTRDGVRWKLTKPDERAS
ncbi:MAG: cysteine--tRNA ligase, partial [Candidatus Aminicenantes bacterium]|nr:cysteine--tRNA ligase [Candidatus Aminicenantes bacterium]